jgi:hypothetical protein
VTYQARFESRWGQLHNPHVRALAWLIDSPGLLDPAATEWAGRLATPIVVNDTLRAWFSAIDADPAPLLAALGERPHTRLGLYAEKLMAFFYQARGTLVAHGLQVRASRNDTVGEFDFLLDAGEGMLEHIELATKFYLLRESAPGDAALRFDTLVGPNLADSLGAKMRKIMDKQLALGSHPAAQAVLPRPLLRARALVKGWLFFRAGSVQMEGIDAAHCAGFWCPLAELPARGESCWVLLPRLQWLAPYRLKEGDCVDGASLAATIANVFESARAPLMVASMRPGENGAMVEHSRGFVVPDDWEARPLNLRN